MRRIMMLLDIHMEFRKGILFVRLKGILSDDTCRNLDNCLEGMVMRKDIRYIVFNIGKLQYIDIEGINTILKYNFNLNRNGGRALLCGINNDLVKTRIENSRMLNYMFEISDELSATNVIDM
jgi:anti-anti-sigma factor